jgi:phytol kinase
MSDSSSGEDEDDERDKLVFYDNTRRLLMPVSALVSLSLVSLAAIGQRLPGPPVDASSGMPTLWGAFPFGVLGYCDSYTPSLVLRDTSSTIACILGATVFVKSITHSAKMGNIESRDSRKIIHTLSVPLFVLLWPLFSNAYGARVFASIVPLLNALRLYLAGTSGNHKRNNKDEGGYCNSNSVESELADAISRSGDARESLGGPFIYVLVLLFSTLLFWRDTPIGIVSLATMACGDGLADLIGRRYGMTNKWSFNRDKSMAGSASFVIGSFVGSFGLINWLIRTGAMDALGLTSVELAWRLLVIAVVCAGVELIPAGDDNITVPISAALLSAFLLG